MHGELVFFQAQPAMSLHHMILGLENKQINHMVVPGLDVQARWLKVPAPP